MNNFIRPALYNASHPIVPLIKNDIKNNIPTDIVGPICESSDRFLTLDNFQKINEGDFLAIKNVGAYGSSMSSNYNVRPRIEEILIDKDKFYTINKKEEFDEMIRNESDSDYLKS
jgi:diaminopimelate decarboxylase